MTIVPPAQDDIILTKKQFFITLIYQKINYLLKNVKEEEKSIFKKHVIR